jgi:tetratricopeptide (TPR) repeat protein
VRRAPLFLLAGALLGAAAFLGSQATGRPGGAASSLGGLRPLSVNAIYLRADALRAQGRHEEVAALYRRILDLDPSSEEALDFLAATQGYDLRAAAPAEEDRVRIYLGALELLESALRRNPGSPRLHWRTADLLFHVPDDDPVVAAALERSGRDRLGEALGHLLVAIRATGSIGGLVEHLDDMVRLAPRVAAERLVEGRPGVEDALAAGEETLRLRSEELASFEPSMVVSGSALDRLRAGIRLVRRVASDLAASPPRLEEARSLLQTYEEALGADLVTEALRRRLGT